MNREQLKQQIVKNFEDAEITEKERLENVMQCIDSNKQLRIGGVSTRYLFKDKQPQIGDYISMYWEDGSDCECIYNGLDESIKPMPIGWYYVDL